MKLKTLFKINIKHYLVMCIMLLTELSAMAQSTVIKHYGTSKGLPSSECYWVTQDSKGYLWIATDAGVVKYDGYKFISYNTSHGLPDNTVFKIHEDKYGRIWFSTYSGKMAYYKHQTDSIYILPANDTLTQLTKTLPVDFAFDTNDTLFVSADRNGFFKVFPPEYKRVSLQTYSSDCVYLKKINCNHYIYGINERVDISQKVRSITPLIVDMFNDLHLKHVDTSFQIPNTGSHNSVTGSNERFFVSSGFSVYILKNKKFRLFIENENLLKLNHPIVSIFLDSKNRLWINTINNGVLVYDVTSEPKLIANFLKGYSVTSTFEDSNNGIWFSTLEDGLFYTPNLDFKFYNAEGGLAADKIHSIVQSKNKLVCLSSDLSLNEIDLSTFNIQVVKPKTKFPFWYLKNFGKYNVLYGSPSLVYTDNIESATLIFRLENGDKKYFRLKDAENIDSLSFLAAEFGSIYTVNKVTGEAKILVNNLPTVFTMCKVGNVIFIGTKTGLYKYVDSKLYFLGDTFPIFKSRMNDIIYANNMLFVGTKGYGVIVFKNNEIIAQYTEREGLASNIVKYLTTDHENNIWVGTNKGISRLKKTTSDCYKINTINLTEGIISNEINELLIHDSLVFFATNKGLGQIHIKDAFNLSTSIPTYIEHLKINTTVYNAYSDLMLPYNFNNFQIAYKGVSVKTEGDITYKYKLEGLDTAWTYTKNTFVQFTTLPSGTYKFVVFSLNADGVASSKPATISFAINLPFWKTWWFYTLLTLLIAGFVSILYFRRVKFIEHKEQEKTKFAKQLAESELKALRAQMNPHFLFNAINSIQNFVLKNDSKSAQKYLTKFARLIRSVLENSKYENVLLKKEIEVLELYIELELVRASFGFDYEIVLEDSLHENYLHIPPMIIQPYVENAILHGLAPLTERRGKLTLTFSQNRNVLHCVIDDNGIGREKAMELKRKKDLGRVSLGIEITSERIELLNIQSNVLTKVNVIDKYNRDLPMGTSIEINIELKKI